MATILAELFVFLLALGKLFFQATAIYFVVKLAMFLPYDFYKVKGGKKSYHDYCDMVFDNMFNAFNEWLEQLFK